MVDQADFTQTVTPHLDEAYNLARGAAWAAATTAPKGEATGS